MNPEFDRKWGADFVATLPNSSGVYIFKDENGLPVYVGKARNLRRRLTQYRMATRKRRQRKMRLIIRAAASLEVQVCADEQAALLLENELIQSLKPALNVAGAFSFMYPYLALKQNEAEPHILIIASGSHPEDLEAQNFQLYGCYRSRAIVQDAYEALIYLLPYLGHATTLDPKLYEELPYTRVHCFRQLEGRWTSQLSRLFAGRDPAFIQDLALHLLEKPRARVMASEVETHLKALRVFYREEAQRLSTVIDELGLPNTVLSQVERDRRFLEWRHRASL